MRSKKKLDEMVLGLLILRMGQGWTQADLARRAGTSASVISEYETGKRRLSFDRLSRIAEAAGLPGAAERLLPYLRVLRVLLDKDSSQDRPYEVNSPIAGSAPSRERVTLSTISRVSISSPPAAPISLKRRAAGSTLSSSDPTALL